MVVQGKRVHYGTAGAAVHVVDVEKREYRESLLQDIYDAARIVDAMDNIHFFQRPMVARDMVDPADLDLNTLYACVMGTTKHVGTSASPFAKTSRRRSTCFTRSPAARRISGRALRLQFELLRRAADEIRRGRLRRARSLCRGWHTDPAPVGGQAARRLLLRSPARWCRPLPRCWRASSMSMRSRPAIRAYSAPGPSCRICAPVRCRAAPASRRCLTAACAQMAQYYDLPGGSAAGMADSKLPDAQSGYEKGITDVMAGLSGLNLVYESAGMHASLLGFLPGEPDHRQRHDRPVPALRARHRGVGGEPVGRVDCRCLPQRAGSLSRPRADIAG
jgi:trimethylamine--corrinoid protein Co-methyltransferase